MPLENLDKLPEIKDHSRSRVHDFSFVEEIKIDDDEEQDQAAKDVEDTLPQFANVEVAQENQLETPLEDQII